MLVSMFFEGLCSDSTISRPTKAILWDLYRLFAVYTIQNDSYECKQMIDVFSPSGPFQVPSATLPAKKTIERYQNNRNFLIKFCAATQPPNLP